MKISFCFAIPAALLFASLALAAPAPPVPASGTAQSGVTSAVVPGEVASALVSFCPAKSSSGPSLLATAAPSLGTSDLPCGTCGDSICDGAQLGTVCARKEGLVYRCWNIYGTVCGGTPTAWECYCWNGPFP